MRFIGYLLSVIYALLGIGMFLQETRTVQERRVKGIVVCVFFTTIVWILLSMR